LNKLEFQVIPQDATQVLEFELGHLKDLFIPESEYRRLSSEEKWKDAIIKGKNLFMCTWGVTLPAPR